MWLIRQCLRYFLSLEKRYFLSLEKRHFNTKTIKQLQLDDKSVINTDEKILKEVKLFYQNCTLDYDDIFFPEGSTGTLEEEARKETGVRFHLIYLFYALKSWATE